MVLLTLSLTLSQAAFVDGDGDGWARSVDCDDSDPEIYPGAPELLDFRDNDCDGEVDERLRVSADPAPVAGRRTSLRIEGGPSSARLYVYASGRLGLAAVPGCPLEELDLRRPVTLAILFTDPWGATSFDLSVPSALAGRAMHVQVVEEGTCLVSDVFSWDL